jgi:hypothetical protein
MQCTLGPVKLVRQWREIERSLPENWGNARFRLTIADESKAERAAVLLAPINPGRRGTSVHFYAARQGSGMSPTMIERLLRRLDEERIGGELELIGMDEAERQPEISSRASLAEAWDVALETLPPDWSDIYAEVELVSSDWLERAALQLAPVNPTRVGEGPVLRFRVAREQGYGASPGMTRRCLERLDQEGIRGDLRILRVLSGTEHVATQGPVWYAGGRAV